MKKQQSKEREPKCKQKNKLNMERDEIKKINLKNH